MDLVKYTHLGEPSLWDLGQKEYGIVWGPGYSPKLRVGDVYTGSRSGVVKWSIRKVRDGCRKKCGDVCVGTCVGKCVRVCTSLDIHLSPFELPDVQFSVLKVRLRRRRGTLEPVLKKIETRR